MYQQTVEKLAKQVISNCEHIASNSGSWEYPTTIEGTQHKDVAEYLRNEGFTVTCVDVWVQRYVVEWRR